LPFILNSEYVTKDFSTVQITRLLHKPETITRSMNCREEPVADTGAAKASLFKATVGLSDEKHGRTSTHAAAARSRARQMPA
jgi:hypothetical protein